MPCAFPPSRGRGKAGFLRLCSLLPGEAAREWPCARARAGKAIRRRVASILVMTLAVLARRSAAGLGEERALPCDAPATSLTAGRIRVCRLMRVNVSSAWAWFPTLAASRFCKRRAADFSSARMVPASSCCASRTALSSSISAEIAAVEWSPIPIGGFGPVLARANATPTSLHATFPSTVGSQLGSLGFANGGVRRIPIPWVGTTARAARAP